MSNREKYVFLGFGSFALIMTILGLISLDVWPFLIGAISVIYMCYLIISERLMKAENHE